MPRKLNFLKPTAGMIRHQIKNILYSYNNDWDLIAELAQNSVDAIRLADSDRGTMTIEVDAPNRRITLEDNGCGIHPDLLPGLLAPFSSNKGHDQTLIGDKGVGISFVIFSSSSFEIESHHEAGSSQASIKGAWTWIDNHEDNLPKLEFERFNSEKKGTRVSVSLPKESQHSRLFDFSFEQLKMIAMTKTAIGDTRTIWGTEPDKEILFKFVNKEGQKEECRLDCSYLLPTSSLTEPHQYISLDEFNRWNTGSRSDAEKRRKLRDKLVYTIGEKRQSGRDIRYWACFVPKRKDWDTISVQANLVEKEILSLSPVDRLEQYGDAEYLFSGGMYTSTRGMPTGIRSEMKAKGSAGYLPNFFIIVDDPQLGFDIGRKSIPSRQLGMLRELASNIFRDLTNSTKKYVSGEQDVDIDGWDRSAVFNEIRELPNMETEETKFLKRPSSQEATVAAIFFELIGKGRLDCFQPYISGYKDKYDLYARYNNSDVVIEFKFTLSSLFRDFDIERKLFYELDIVVVWEIVEKDHETTKKHGVDLQEIDGGISQATSDPFHFLLSGGMNKPIKIICLKNLIFA